MAKRTPITWLHKREDKLRAWEKAAPGRTRKAYYRCFTACFTAVALLLVFIYLINGRDLIWVNDGMDQYFPFFVYEGQWLRDLFGGLFTGQGWHPELWSWSLGYGSDTLSTLDVFWDPLNLTSALVPGVLAEYLFSFLVVARMYLAGVTFSAYALYRGNGRFATLCGALVYAFAGPALIGLFWPGGVNPLILFPLLLLGAEKVLDRKRPTVFILSTALFFIVSYYAAYAACILLALYLLIRVFQVEAPMTPARFLGWVARFAAFLVVGALIAAAALVPSATAVLGTERATTALAQIPTLYSLDFYARIIGGFLSWTVVGSDCYIGFGGLAFLAVVLLFIRKKCNTALKIVFIVLTVFLLIPFFGSLFNGFNYATNRWIWAYDLCIAYIVVKMMPSLEDLTRRDRNGLIAAAAVYALAILLVPASRIESVIAALAALLALIVVLTTTRESAQSTRRYLIVGAVGIGLFVNIFYFTDTGEKGFTDNSVPLLSGYQKLTADSPNSLVAALDDDTYWRYDADAALVSSIGGSWVRVDNDSVVLGINGIDFYNSIYNDAIDRFHTELGIAADDVNFMYSNLGGRSILETICNVKYFVFPNAGGETTTYNYGTHVVNSGIVRNSPVTVYEGDNTLPLGFTYAHTIKRSEYDSLSALAKQEALLQGIVVADDTAASAAADGIDAIEPISTSQTVASSVVSTNGATVEDGVIIANKAGATVTLSVAGLPGCETYLEFANLDYAGLSPLDLTSQATFDSLPWYRKALLVSQDLSYIAPNTYYVYAQSDKGSANRAIANSSKSWHMYGGKSNWSLNLGYSEQAQSTVTLTLSAAGRYTYDDLQVACQPMTNMNDQVNTLKSDVMENTEVGIDHVSGTIDLAEAKYLYFSIPYSTGWSATVDGQPATLTRANTAFMALELSPGEHTIELSYCTPGLKLGGALTLTGIVLFAGIMLWYRRRDKRHTL